MQKDWVTFYNENKAPLGASSFACFVKDMHLDGVSTIVDLGSGNGRDTYTLAMLNREGAITIGIDPCARPRDSFGAAFIQSPWGNQIPIIREASMVYSRFFLHAVPFEDTVAIISCTKKYFCAEARAVGDTPQLYPEHKRYFVDGDELLHALYMRDFEILHYEKRRGLAPYKNEDPLVVRVIAKRKHV